MQPLAQTTPCEIHRRLRGAQLRLRIGPFVVSAQGGTQDFAEQLHQLYAGALMLEEDEPPLTHYHLRLVGSKGMRRWLRPTVNFDSDFDQPMTPLPRFYALPMFEWGFNWIIATRSQQYLMLHAAVLERGGRALVLPAEPGSGKSTLAAALMFRGWRLLSDEFAILQVRDGKAEFRPLPRPVPLKNESTSLIREFAPEAVMGPLFPKTRKGDVVHCAAPADAQARAQETARAGWIVFPRFTPGSRALIGPYPTGRAFLQVSGNSFNYRLMGERGFREAWTLLEQSETFQMRHSDLGQACELLTRLADGELNLQALQSAGRTRD